MLLKGACTVKTAPGCMFKPFQPGSSARVIDDVSEPSPAVPFSAKMFQMQCYDSAAKTNLQLCRRAYISWGLHELEQGTAFDVPACMCQTASPVSEQHLANLCLRDQRIGSLVVPLCIRPLS